jgi:hypothetical protein
MRKNVTVAYFKALYQQLLVGADETINIVTGSFHGENGTWDLPI